MRLMNLHDLNGRDLLVNPLVLQTVEYPQDGTHGSVLSLSDAMVIVQEPPPVVAIRFEQATSSERGA